MKRTRIRTLFLGGPKGNNYPAQENQEWPIYQGEFSHESLFAHYKEKLKLFEHDVEFTGLTLARTRSDLEGIGEQVQDEAGILVFILGLFPSALQNEITSWGKPTVMVNPTESPLSPLAWLHNYVPVKGKSHVIPVLSSDFADVGKKIGVLKAVHKMRRSKVLYQQTLTPKQVESSRKWYEEGWGGINLFSDLTPLSDSFIEQAKARLGLEIKDIPPHRLIAAYQNADTGTAEELAQRWITGATDVVEPTSQDVVESCKLYLGIKQILKEEDAQAITEHGICMGRGPYPLPCLAFTMLNDEGLAGICQLDLSSTITQLLIGYLADRPGFIGPHPHRHRPQPDRHVARLQRHQAGGLVQRRSGHLRLPQSPGAVSQHLSQRTEMNVYRGSAPMWQRKRDPRTRLFVQAEQPDWQYPLRYGYACVGEVTDVGSDVAAMAEGDLVYCAAPHQSAHVLPAKSVVKLPQGIEPKVGVLMANLNTTLNGVLDADLHLGECVVVFGLGVLGQLTVQWAKLSGASPVITVDPIAKLCRSPGMWAARTWHSTRPRLRTL